MLLISDALAQTAASQPPSIATQVLPLILVLAVFYFIVIRPQQKRFKEHQELISSLKRGDKVVTGGGIMGKITKVDDDEHITVEIASGVEVKVVRSTVTSAVSKADAKSKD